MARENHHDERQEHNDLKTLVTFRGKSELIAQELLENIDKLKSIYHWSDDKTIRMFGSKLRGNKLLEWLYTVKQLPEDEDKWEVVKSAFERDFIRMSKIKRWKSLTKIKQRKGQSLEVYRGTLEKLIGPTGIKEEEKVAIFIMGLRKHYKHLLGSKRNYKTLAEVIQKLRENEDFDDESEDEGSSDMSDSSSESESSDSSDSDSDYDRKRNKKKQKKKVLRKKNKNKKKQPEDLISKQLRTVQNKLEQLMKSPPNTVFAVSERPSFEDLKTTNGLDVCGRCQRVGHRHDNCPRLRMRCNYCGILGHITPECRRKPNMANMNTNFANNSQQFQNTRRNNFNNNNGNQNRPPITCFNCNQPGHVRQKCPQLNQKVAAVNSQVNGNGGQGVLNN